MVSVKRLLRNTAPLCFLPNGNLVCYHRGNILILHEEQIISSLPLPAGIVERFLGWNRYATRLLRLGIRAAIALDNNYIIISRGNMLYEFDLDNGELSKGWYCGEGVRPLIFTEVNDIDGFDNGVYFGGYMYNLNKAPVHIYQRIEKDVWKVVYTFSEGLINHIHNIVADPYRNCLWIFTGDFDESAAIWKVSDYFNKVERIAYNNQKYRGCIAYSLPEGLLYATDAPFADNYIYLLKPDNMNLKELYPINGSCIYGGRWKDKYIFTSTVEGDGRDESITSLFWKKKRGLGIKDDFAHVYCGNEKKGFAEIYKEKKDNMPYLFQYGAFKFPSGINNTGILYSQPVATKNNDMQLLVLKIV